MTAALSLGFLIGMRHALEADHLAAMASLLLRAGSPRNAIRQGAVWGLGHTLTLFAVGSFVVLAGSAVPSGVAALLEAGVGLMLILLGLDVARRMIRDRVHFHVHDHHGGQRHFHAHSHRGEARSAHDAHPHGHAHRTGFPGRALYVGLMHGLAGSAALVFLALDGSDSALLGLAYMGLFGLGSMAGMALLSAVISWPLSCSGGRLTRLHHGFQGLVGALNVGLGAWLLLNAIHA